MPAYILSELKTAFQIGAVLFPAFLIIDLVVASVTLSIGMIQLPPVMLFGAVQSTAVRAGGMAGTWWRLAGEGASIERRTAGGAVAGAGNRSA